MLISIIIILVLILIILIALFCAFLYIRNKTKTISRELFGTEDITKAASQMRQDYATTPKSVSAMTSLMLPKIVHDFPDFQYDEMKNRAENVLTSYLHAVTTQDTNALKDGSDELKLQLENQINAMLTKHWVEHFDNVHIHRTEINQYRKVSGRCIITFQTALECMYYVTDSAGDIREGTREYKYQTKFNTDLVYVQDREKLETDFDSAMGLNCPNCGAPITTLGAKFCEYCGTGIIEINIHTWAFCNIDEIK